MPQRYPMSQRYYDDLFGGKLGFTLVEVADRYPNLLGVAFVDDTLHDPGLPVPPLIQNEHVAPITINLGHADESFSVYDHQKVLIFKKTQNLTPTQLRRANRSTAGAWFDRGRPVAPAGIQVAASNASADSDGQGRRDLQRPL